MRTTPADYSCPSAQPDSVDARVFGVVLGSVDEPRIAYMEKGVSVAPETLDGLAGISPTRVFRFAGRCENGACAQFRDGTCRLGADIASRMTAVTDAVPACAIRATCRWFAENGAPVCLRCARVVTDVRPNDPLLAPIASLAPPPTRDERVV